MQTIIYNKLVRDKIPEIIQDSGKIARTTILSTYEVEKALDNKLQEEVAEFLSSHSSEEIADILEVLHAIAERKELSWNEIEAIRLKKKEDRGGFQRGMFLRSVEEN